MITDVTIHCSESCLHLYMHTAAKKCKDKQLEVDRYEFLVYRLLRNALEAGNVYVRDSNDFRSFEDDLGYGKDSCVNE